MSARVAFQGEHGAYSEEAIYQHCGRDIETVPCRTFEEVFAAVDRGLADASLVPVENSTAGSINRSYDLLLEHDLRVQGEVLKRVSHNLLAPKGTRLEDVRQVKSHPQALAQCERWLSQRTLTAITAYDTAGAAKELAAHPEPNTAAVASALAAEIYELDIIAQGIEDLANNYTRFFLIGYGESPRSENSRTSLVFAVPNQPGSLHAALGEFASRGINLVKIESRPRRNRPWHYVFYLDFDGHWQDPDCSAALVSLLGRAAFVKLLGSYPAAPLPAEAVSGQEATLQI